MLERIIRTALVGASFLALSCGTGKKEESYDVRLDSYSTDPQIIFRSDIPSNNDLPEEKDTCEPKSWYLDNDKDGFGDNKS